IIPTADRQKATVKVRVGFNEPDPRILPEMGVKVAFRSDEEPEGTAPAAAGVTIPADAIRTADGRDFVWVVNAGTAERREVSVTRSSDGEVTVGSGLSAGERV